MPTSHSTSLTGWRQCLRLSESLLLPSQGSAKEEMWAAWGGNPRPRASPTHLDTIEWKGWVDRAQSGTPGTITHPPPCPAWPWSVPPGSSGSQGLAAGVFVRYSGPCGQWIKLGPVTFMQRPTDIRESLACASTVGGPEEQQTGSTHGNELGCLPSFQVLCRALQRLVWPLPVNCGVWCLPERS